MSKIVERYPLKIVFKCDLESKWCSVDPVLKYKEFVVSILMDGSDRYKIGDGESKYQDLDFVPLEYVLENGMMYFNFSPFSEIRFILKSPKIMEQLLHKEGDQQ